jgi:hypothetical protein
MAKVEYQTHLVWQCVDHMAECYLRPFKDEISIKQEELRQQSSIELFFIDYPYELSEKFATRVRDLHESYYDACMRTGSRPVSLTKFTMKIRTEVFPELQTHRKAEGMYCNLAPVRVSSFKKELA